MNAMASRSTPLCLQYIWWIGRVIATRPVPLARKSTSRKFEGIFHWGPIHFSFLHTSPACLKIFTFSFCWAPVTFVMGREAIAREGLNSDLMVTSFSVFSDTFLGPPVIPWACVRRVAFAPFRERRLSVRPAWETVTFTLLASPSPRLGFPFLHSHLCILSPSQLPTI